MTTEAAGRSCGSSPLTVAMAAGAAELVFHNATVTCLCDKGASSSRRSAPHRAMNHVGPAPCSHFSAAERSSSLAVLMTLRALSAASLPVLGRELMRWAAKSGSLDEVSSSTR